MTSIASLRHMVALCSGSDVVVSPGSIESRRPPIFTARADIQPKRAQQWSPQGFAAFDEKERPSHDVAIRFRPDIDITRAAWLFEERLQSGRRWFKVLGVVDVEERGRFWKLSCRLVEKGVEAPAPTQSPPATVDGKPSAPVAKKKSTLPSAQGLPPGVKL